MKRKKKKQVPARYVLLVMILFCIVILGCSLGMSLGTRGVSTAAGYVIVPMQKGINRIGSSLSGLRDQFVLKKKLLAENEELRGQLAQAREELNRVQVDREELEHLKQLYEMDQTFPDFEKTAAKVVAKDAGNWFSLFLIDKGKKDGIREGMNVIADGGLAGIVIDVGPNYAKVRSIIDDNSNVSGKNLSTEDLCIVSGSLKTMNEKNQIEFSDLRDKEGKAAAGDQIVTSNISDLFLEGIPIGYLTEINTDANNLTKSGTLATIVDFEHLDSVFVIMQTKDYSEE